MNKEERIHAGILRQISPLPDGVTLDIEIGGIHITANLNARNETKWNGELHSYLFEWFRDDRSGFESLFTKECSKDFISRGVAESDLTPYTEQDYLEDEI